MAKPRSTKSKDDNTEKTKLRAEDVRPVIGKTKLKQLLASARSTKADVDEIVGTHRQQIADAVENHHLHKGAFAVIKRLDRMEPEKLADFLDCFEHMLDISGLNDRAKQVQRLGLDDGDDNVHEFPTQQAAE